MNLELKGKNVFVSASSDGIGKAIAGTFLKEGANVIINGRNKEKVSAVAASFSGEFGEDRCEYYAGDMSDPTAIDNLISFISQANKKLDILVCNLGSGKGMNPDKYADAEWDRLFNINLFSSVRLIDACVPLMNEGGAVICLSSLVSFDKIGAPPAYAAAKAGVNSLVKYLADDLSNKGIRVNGVAPGNVFYEGGRWEELLAADTEGVTEYISNNVPLKRFGTPEEIADAIVFLSSERASFITGTVLKVDGGQSRGY